MENNTAIQIKNLKKALSTVKDDRIKADIQAKIKALETNKTVLKDGKDSN